MAALSSPRASSGALFRTNDRRVYTSILSGALFWTNDIRVYANVIPTQSSFWRRQELISGPCAHVFTLNMFHECVNRVVATARVHQQESLSSQKLSLPFLCDLCRPVCLSIRNDRRRWRRHRHLFGTASTPSPTLGREQCCALAAVPSSRSLVREHRRLASV